MSERGAATRSIRFELDVAVPAEQVWPALTEAEELVRWFPTRAEVVPGPGGSVLWAWGDAWDWRHRIDAWEPPRLLRLVQDVPQRFDADGNPVEDRSTGEPMALDFTLTPRGRTTHLALVHSGFGSGRAWDEELEATRTGWTVELTGLKRYLEQHRGQDRRVGWATASSPLGREEVWRRLLSGEALGMEAPRLEPGEPFTVAAATGDRFSGRILVAVPEREVAGLVDGLDGGILRVSAHSAAGRTGMFVWLSCFSGDGDVAGFERRATNLLAGLFPREAGTCRTGSSG